MVFGRHQREQRRGDGGEKHYVVRHFKRRHLYSRLINDNDVHGVRECRHQHQRHSQQRDMPIAVALVQQGYARQTQKYRKHRGQRGAFLEKHRHYHRHHHRIGKEYRGGDARVDMLERGIERQRRSRENHPQRRQNFELPCRQPQRHPLYFQYQKQNQHRQRKTVKNHTRRVQSLVVEKQRPQRVGAVRHRRRYPCEISLQPFVHIFLH